MIKRKGYSATDFTRNGARLFVLANKYVRTHTNPTENYQDINCPFEYELVLAVTDLSANQEWFSDG